MNNRASAPNDEPSNLAGDWAGSRECPLKCEVKLKIYGASRSNRNKLLLRRRHGLKTKSNRHGESIEHVRAKSSLARQEFIQLQRRNSGSRCDGRHRDATGMDSAPDFARQRRLLVSFLCHLVPAPEVRKFFSDQGTLALKPVAFFGRQFSLNSVGLMGIHW